MRLLLPLAYVCGCAAAAAHSVVGNNADFQKRQVNGSFIETKAPHDNIWADITDREERSIQKFLRQQRNLTVPGDMEFDWYPMWLLAPNKTDATAYLEGKGHKPKRYARVLGEADCYTREYMVGPLPVCSKTKAIPLDYANHGNATRATDYCDDEEFRVPGGNSTRMQNGPPGRPQREHPDERRKRNLDKVLQRRSPSNPYSEEQKWDGKKLPHDEKQPPVTILPDGARFEFDPEQNYVSWMGFTFYVAISLSGVSLHDVRFNGERVIYELAMQEALAHYAGPGADQNYASYLDVSIDFTTFNLIPGFDCPAYATYTNAFCLFEFPKDYPMSRHMDWEYYHATRNVAFMLRSISTVGNYDYQTTYEFHHDGTIQVIVRASGYIQGDDEPEDDQAGEYGYRIREDLSGSMHDHVLNFKADLDIKGTKNSLYKTEFVPNTQVYPWSGGALFNNMKAERSTIASEDEGKINWAANSAAMYSIVNKDKPNEFGEYPGFRIFPSLGSAIHLTVENSTVFPNKLNWATHHLYALAHKDEEPVAAHPNDGWTLGDPRTRFEDFFDGQSLEQEDLVLYFNLGMHHMPDTYDLPVTVFQGAQSGITLRPINYQRSNNAASTRQQIHILNKGGKAVVEKYGVQDLSGSYDLGNANPQDTPVPNWDPDEHSEDGDWEEE